MPQKGPEEEEGQEGKEGEIAFPRQSPQEEEKGVPPGTRRPKGNPTSRKSSKAGVR